MMTRSVNLELRLTLAGPDSQITSSLCAHCPHSTAGCCVAPPPLSFADLGRIVQHGGRDWLLGELANGNLVRSSRGLPLKRTKGRTSDVRGAPRLTRCVFHGPLGCTIPETRRSVTCNVYICESALEKGRAKPERDTARAARLAHAEIVKEQVRLVEQLTARVHERYPAGEIDPPYDAAFFDWLGELHASLMETATSPGTS